MAKGGEFERQIADRLSCWWLGEKGPKPSRRIFWRSSGSGGTSRRASMRHHAGDLCHVDPAGAVFTELIAVEIKRGYNKVSLQDLLDCPNGQKGGNGRGQNLPDWIVQAEEARDRAEAYSWMLIVRRDGRREVVVLPHYLFLDLTDRSGRTPYPLATVRRDKIVENNLFVTPLCQFLECVTPAVVRRLFQEM